MPNKSLIHIKVSKLFTNYTRACLALISITIISPAPVICVLAVDLAD